MSRRVAALAALAVAVTALCVPAAGAAPKMLVGVFDDAQFLYGDPTVSFKQLSSLHAQVLRRRLETAGVPVMIDWTGGADDRRGVLLVPDDQGQFAAAVVNEIDVDDEVADNSPHAYVARIEEHLSAAAGLLAELRAQLDELEADGKL